MKGASDDLTRHMHEARIAYLSALFDRCRRRFVEAARLVGADLAQWPNLNVVGLRTGVDVFDLLPFWDELCRRRPIIRDRRSSITTTGWNTRCGCR